MTHGWPTSLAGIPTLADRLLSDVVGRLAGSGSDPESTVAAVVEAVAERKGMPQRFRVDGAPVAADPAVRVAVEAVPAEVIEQWGPWLPGLVREGVLSQTDRHRRGVYHTPPALVRKLVAATVSVVAWDDATEVLDPAVGGGAFLLAAAEQLPGDRRSVVARLAGVDVDPLAVATTRAALALWAGVEEEVLERNLWVGDFLDPELMGDRQFAAVVGNPPFLSQLRRSTVRSSAERRRLADRWPGVGRYVDEAAAFALAGADCVAPGGTLTLVQPTSVLAAGDAEPVRERLERSVPLVALWVDEERAFSAAVDTVTLIGRRAPAVATVEVGGCAVPRPAPRTWGPLLAAAHGVPDVGVSSAQRLGDVATITAGFRQHYYGLVGAVNDDQTGRYRLMTSGLIDPLRSRWGQRCCRFAKQVYQTPTVDPMAVAEEIADWLDAQLVPKVMVASQTRVIEAVVDDSGVCVPATPVVSVMPSEGVGLWRVAAVLTSPVATALLVGAASGTALSPGSVRVSASALTELPLPEDHESWEAAARLAKDGAVHECGRMMLRAYGLTDRDDVFRWWWDRNPT